jgi:hypothetical protein
MYSAAGALALDERPTCDELQRRIKNDPASVADLASFPGA